MFAAILALLLLPVTDVSRSRGMQFRPLSKIAFFIFVANFLILMQLGAKHVESPFIEFGQISTVVYFFYFTVVMFAITIIENTFVSVNLTGKKYSFTHRVNETLNPLQSAAPIGFFIGLFSKI
jgi:ubiquinol-cytochrome c reductase cytochrome b subunit